MLAEIDLPATITAFSALVTAVALAVATIKNAAATRRIEKVAVAIDDAVNNRDGGTTVSQDVAAMAARFPAQDKAAKVVLNAGDALVEAVAKVLADAPKQDKAAKVVLDAAEKQAEERATNGGGVSLKTPEEPEEEAP